MTIPKSIKVGGITYDVQIVDVFEEPDTMACIDYENQLIKIKKGKPDFMKQTFLHELFHAMNEEFDEEKTEFYAVSLYQIFKDNPELLNES